MQMKEEALSRLESFNRQLTGLQREVMAVIAILSAPEEDKTPFSVSGTLPPSGTAESSAPTGLTEETPEQTEDAQLFARHAELLRNFVGHSSLFAMFLSPELWPGGKGFIKPNGKDIKQYLEDIRTIPPAKFLNPDWPTVGFFRNAESKYPQFFLKMDDFLLWVDATPQYQHIPEVVRLPLVEHAKAVRLTELSPETLTKVRESLETGLIAANRLLGNT